LKFILNELNEWTIYNKLISKIVIIIIFNELSILNLRIIKMNNKKSIILIKILNIIIIIYKIPIFK